MERLILDVDALSHGSGLNLLPHVELLIGSLPDRAHIERSVYTEAVRTGLGQLLDDWLRRGLVRDPVDYRRLPDGDRLFKEAGSRWPGLSRQDRASLIVARALGHAGLLTCEKALSGAASAVGIFAVDLFDVIRFSVRAGHVMRAAAADLCSTWDANPFSAGRPIDYQGSFEAELAERERSKPLPER